MRMMRSLWLRVGLCLTAMLWLRNAGAQTADEFYLGKRELTLVTSGSDAVIESSGYAAAGSGTGRRQRSILGCQRPSHSLRPTSSRTKPSAASWPPSPSSS